MQANHLKSPELSYEIQIRNFPVPDTVEQKRRVLTGLLARENSNRSFSSPVNAYTFEDDILEVTETITELTDIINQFSGNKNEPVFSRINSRLTHLTNRINRLNAESNEQLQTQQNLTTKLILLEADLSTKTTPTPNNRIEDTLPSNTFPSPTLSDIPHQKHDPVYKWNVSFTGKNESLHLFLEKVEVLRLSRGVTENELFLQSCELFKGNAFTWYLNNRSKFQSWKDIVAKLKADFLPYSYETDLELEISNRTMGANEPVAVYISSMIGLFNRLSGVVDEHTRVAKIRRNLLPSFISSLALHNPQTVDELTELCKRIEESRVWSDRYRSPSSNYPRLLEPDLSCLYVSSPSNQRQKTSANVSALTSLVCWNCDKTGHSYSQCFSSKSIFCYGCGAKNTTKPKCRKCSQKNLRQTGPLDLATVSSQAQSTTAQPENPRRTNRLPNRSTNNTNPPTNQN